MVLSTLQLAQNTNISCNYSSEPIEQILSDPGLLAAINFGHPCQASKHSRLYHCGLTALESPAAPPVIETWHTSEPVEHGIDGRCQWSQTDELLFAGMVVDESLYDNPRHAINDTYRQLLDFANSRGYRHIMRVWNYLPAINLGNGDQERYKQFCSGRQQAFEQARYQDDEYPAACALGHNDTQNNGHSIVYFIASREPGRHFENPNQHKAYQYPRQYGPQSPSFARATLAQWPTSGQQLFVSGTASIVGHETLHADDLQNQLATTLNNIDKLLAHVGQRSALSTTPAMSILKVYLRRPQDLDTIKAAVIKHFGDVPALYLQADICRQDLLVEIDGLCDL